MYINFRVEETSEVKRLNDLPTMLQGENNYIILRFYLPETLKGYTITNYAGIAIKFESERGEIVKEYAQGTNTGVIEFPLKQRVTNFKNVRVQLLLENSVDETEVIKWRSIPFRLEFEKSINAEMPKEELQE